MLPILILAGGLGTRLGDLTQKCPKALMEAAGEPFICHQLRLLKRNDLRKVIICAGYLGGQIEEAVGSGQKFGLDISYSYDYPRLLGTGGAVRQAARNLAGPFLVTYGDSYLDIDYQAVIQAFNASPCPALMAVYRNDGLFDRSNVIYDQGKLLLYDKKNPDPAMNYIDYGLSCLDHDIIMGAPQEDVFDLADLMSDLSRQGRLAGFLAFKRFYEIGSPQSLAEFDHFLRSKHN
ncbi:MAG: NTP transferase domain-containing protein [Deltaproteobacteria bacterium]|jgi:NDP-sugar pyrophosphorylase family protein|nr:NTP transferase domain-containing protein [Deltaproteobacteria bacterium]